MNPTARPLIFATLLTGLQYLSVAQQRTPSAAWLFPGVSWNPAKKTSLLVQAGYNHYLAAGLFYPEAFITVHKNIVLNPAYIFFVQRKEASRQLTEHYLMNAIILKAAGRKIFIEDRNMLWDRFATGAGTTHYYRNRLKVGLLFKTGEKITRLYGYDELYYLFNYNIVTRNRIAFGISHDLASFINAEVTYVRQWDRNSGNLNLFFIMGTWQW